MNELLAKIEAVLFLSTKPVTYRALARILEISESDVVASVQELARLRNVAESGIHLVQANSSVELGSNPAFASILETVSKEENAQELTRPQLETLTIVAYRGPITKAEIEHIRGVNCSLILRNLLTRGFIIEQEDAIKFGESYTISSDLLRFLGLHDVSELPDYTTLHGNEKITAMLERLFDEPEEASS